MATASAESPAPARPRRPAHNRILLVLVSTLVVITLAAGSGTWFLAARSTRTSAITEVLTSAKSFGPIQSGQITLPLLKKGTRGRRIELSLLERFLHLSSNLASADFLRADNPSKLTDATVPRSVLTAVASSPVLGSPSAVAGSAGSKAWAVERVDLRFVSPNGTGATLSVPFVLVLTRNIGTPSLWGALVLAAAVVAFAIVAGLVLTRRLTRPLRRAVATTERIAAGDLEARVGSVPGDFPELSTLANAIDTMAASLGALRNAERQFLLSVSHELRTPLTSIRGYSEAILDGTAIDPAVAAAVIGNESRRLERLVGDLLDLAKLDTKTFSFHFRTVDVTEVVEEVAEELRPLADAAGLSIAVRPPPGPLLARVDPDRLDQVLANLVENAAKFARSTITLGAALHSHLGQLVVEDDGAGIPADELPRIFERHYSTDRHARPGRPRGSGLGLAIASELSAAMGASLRAESPAGPGGGTKMVVQLPVLAVQPADGPVPEPNGAPEQGFSPSQNPHGSHIGP